MTRTATTIAALLIGLAGCGETAPPLDQLPLRDALRAEPEVIAALPDPARHRLAARLEVARTTDVGGDLVAAAGDEALTAAAAAPDPRIARMDVARARRGAEPLIVGALGAGSVEPLRDSEAPQAAAPLPALEAGPSPTPITALEARALDSNAAGPLRALLFRSGARRLRRVVGWPTGAVAMGDVIYVNAAWLAALAPDTSVDVDAGADAGPPASAGTGAANAVHATAALPIADVAALGGSQAAQPAAAAVEGGPGSPQALPDGGAGSWPPPTDPSGGAPPAGSADACASSSSSDSCSSNPDSCDSSSNNDDSCSGSTDDGSGADSCDGSTDDGSGTDACAGSTTDDSGTDACASSTTDDSGSGASCQVARGPRRGGTGTGTFVTLLAPLAFLLPRRRR